MAGKFKTIYLAKNLNDVFSQINNIDKLQIIGGATQIKELSDACLSIRSIPDLSNIEKHETYIDFGPAVTLSQMLNLEHSNLPEFLKQAIKSVAYEPIRNIATLGGNICAKGYKHTLWAPLLALNAYLEFKSAKNTKTIPFDKFTEAPQKYVLTNIRIPLKDWDVSIFKRIGPANVISNLSASFVFLVNTQKDIITTFKVAYAGPFVFHSHELENRLISKKLPLNKDFIREIIADADRIYDSQSCTEYINPLLKAEFLNLLRNSLEQLR